MLKAIHGGPWFILNHFLYVHKWEPKFIASATQLTYSAIWVRLPELPTENMDHSYSMEESIERHFFVDFFYYPQGVNWAKL